MSKYGIPLGSKMSAEPSLDEPEEQFFNEDYTSISNEMMAMDAADLAYEAAIKVSRALFDEQRKAYAEAIKMAGKAADVAFQSAINESCDE